MRGTAAGARTRPVAIRPAASHTGTVSAGRGWTAARSRSKTSRRSAPGAPRVTTAGLFHAALRRPPRTTAPAPRGGGGGPAASWNRAPTSESLTDTRGGPVRKPDYIPVSSSRHITAAFYEIDPTEEAYAMTTAVTRRGLLKLAGAGAGTAAFSALGFDLAEATEVKQQLHIAGATESHSLCPYCAVGCSLIAYTRKRADGSTEIL